MASELEDLLNDLLSSDDESDREVHLKFKHLNLDI